MRNWLKKLLSISFFSFTTFFIFNSLNISIKANLKLILPLLLIYITYFIKKVKHIKFKIKKTSKNTFYPIIFLILMNFVFYCFNINENQILNSKIIFGFNLLILVYLINIIDIKKQTHNKINKGSFVLIILLTVIAGYLRFKNLGNFDIYHDEFYYASSIKSYLHNSSTNLWDYISNAPSETLYKKGITEFVGTFVKIFGYSEYNLRFLFALIGTLTIPAIFLTSYLLFENKYISFLSAIFLTFSDIHIYLSRFIRQYSFFIFFIQILAITIIIGTKKLNKFNIKNIIYLLLPLLIIIFSFTYISVFSVMYIFIYIIYLYFFYKDINLKNKKILILLLIFLILSFLSIDLFTNIKIFNIKHILENNIEIKLSKDIVKNYLNWLFIDLKTNSIYLGVILTILSSIKITKEKNIKKSWILLAFFYIPLILIIINQKHSYDFRYLSPILPFLYILLAYFLISISIKKEMFVIIFSILFFIKPSFPNFIAEPFFIKAQANWQEDDGKRINSRTVAPSYKKSYYYLESNSNKFDKSDVNLLIIDGIQYLPIYSRAKYYILNSYLSNPIEYSTNEKVDYDELFNEKLIIVGAYVHWIQEDYLEKIKKECTQVNSNSFYFQYNLSYEKLDSKYPSIFLCNFN